MKTSKLLKVCSVLFLGGHVLAQTVAPVTTTVVYDPITELRTITQTGSGNSALSAAAEPLRFTFEKLDTVNGGIFNHPSFQIQSVRLTFQFLAEDAELTITNNNATDFEFTATDTITIDSNFTASGYKWIYGTAGDPSTFDGATTLSGSNFEQSFGPNLDGVVLQEDGTLGDTVVYTYDFDVTQDRFVDASQESDYDGAGTWTHDVWNNYVVTLSLAGSGISAQQNVPSGEYFATVEYIVIPEPGALALAGIAMATAGGLFLARRKRA